MAKQANRMMIGMFVVMAVILLAASLVVFGSGKFFKKTQSYVMYFQESVKGLNVGAPVLFQGVQVGSVASIIIRADLEKLEAQIPVVIEIEPEKFQIGAEAARKLHRDPRKNMARLIEKGLRAQLAAQSLITGQLLVELDFHPGTPVLLRGADQDSIEIPTIPSVSERLAQALGDLDLKGIEKHLLAVLSSVDRLVSNPDLGASFGALKDTLAEARKLLTRVDRQVDPVAADLKQSVKEIGKLARNTDAKLGPLESGLDKTMSSARGVLAADSPLMVELENALKEVAAASRSLKQLADYLDQHPEALLRGKKNPGGK